MESIKSSIDYRTIGVKEFNPIGTIGPIVSQTQADQLVDEAVDLISDQKFRPYFFKTLYVIGASAFIEAMQIARKSEADCRPCIFVKRLRDVRRAVEAKAVDK